MTIAQAVQEALGQQQAGRLAEAEALYRRVLAADPGQPDALHMLGVIANQCGHPHDASVLVMRSLELAPDNPWAIFNLGHIWQALGQWEKAREQHARAAALLPDLPAAHYNLGVVLQHLRRLEEARRCYERTLDFQPDHVDALTNLGVTLVNDHRFREAERIFDRALPLCPERAELHYNLGVVYVATHRIGEARRGFQRALELRPDFPEAHNNLSGVLMNMGQLDASLQSRLRAIELKPGDVEYRSNLIVLLHYHPDTTPASLQAECQRWDDDFAAPLRGSRHPHANDPDPQRRLKIGYVSTDLREHPVGFFLAPLLMAHDHAQVEIYCYAKVPHADETTARLRSFADVWRDVAAVSDEALAEQVRADGIDILMDLGLHGSGPLLLTFARQPAPVQVSWLAYAGSTGLETIRYRFTDARIDPPGSEPETGSVESAVRLPDCWCCFEPPANAPPVGALPASRNAGRVTFGSLNNFAKVNARVLRLWAAVLKAVPGSTLMPYCPSHEAQRTTSAVLAEEGVDPSRVRFVAWMPKDEYLRLYAQEIDIGLDPFPFNGMTTTCDALWMGVPVVTLPGELAVSRTAASLLAAVGLDELVATDERDYARIAVELAGDLPRLVALRAGLRERMLGSPLMDASRFARHVETAYRAVWQRWCAEAGNATARMGGDSNPRNV